MTDTVTQCSGTIGKECLRALAYTIHSSQERNLEGLGEESLARRGPFLMMCKAGLGKVGRRGERCSETVCSGTEECVQKQGREHNGLWEPQVIQLAAAKEVCQG